VTYFQHWTLKKPILQLSLVLNRDNAQTNSSQIDGVVEAQPTYSFAHACSGQAPKEEPACWTPFIFLDFLVRVFVFILLLC
jgi:hypothetical protein